MINYLSIALRLCLSLSAKLHWYEIEKKKKNAQINWQMLEMGKMAFLTCLPSKLMRHKRFCTDQVSFWIWIWNLMCWYITCMFLFLVCFSFFNCNQGNLKFLPQRRTSLQGKKDYYLEKGSVKLFMKITQWIGS